MDKWVPLICIIFSAILVLVAYSLWNLNITDASDNTIKKGLQIKGDSIEDIFSKHKILLVPGHDLENYGAKFNDLKEEEINLELSKIIYNLFEKDERFDVFITRNENGYTKEFSDYFTNQKEEIDNFIYENKEKTRDSYRNGEFEPVRVVEHNLAAKDVFQLNPFIIG